MGMSIDGWHESHNEASWMLMTENQSTDGIIMNELNISWYLNANISIFRDYTLWFNLEVKQRTVLMMA